MACSELLTPIRCAMNDFVVYGNYGDLTVHRSTGAVLQYEPDRDSETGTEYDQILRFDIDEYAAAYPNEEFDHLDICDIGFWTRDGQYEPPEPTFRAELTRDRARA